MDMFTVGAEAFGTVVVSFMAGWYLRLGIGVLQDRAEERREQVTSA